MKDYKQAEFPFVMLPMAMLCGLFTAKEIAVFAALLKYSDKNMECFPSRKRLSRDAGMSVKSLDSTIKSLKDKGLIDVYKRYTPDGRMTTNRYKLYDFLHADDDAA